MTKTTMGWVLVMFAATSLAACVGADPGSDDPQPSSDPAPAATNDPPTATPQAPPSDPPKAPEPPKPACNIDKPFNAPKPLTSLHSDFYDVFPRLTADELTIVFARESAYGQKPGRDIYIARRASTSAPFDAALPVTGVNSDVHESDPSISDDGLTLYFTSTRLGANEHHLFVAKRPTINDAFGAPAPVTELNSSGSYDRVPIVVRNGNELWFASNRADGQGSSDIYRSLRVGAAWGPAMNVSELNSPSTDLALAVSADATVVYFSSLRAGGQGEDIWMAKRKSIDVAFGEPTNVTELNTAGADGPGWVSPDGCRLYLHSTAGTTDYDLYVAEKPKE